MDGFQAFLTNLIDDIQGCWRYRWRAMSVAWIVCLVGWGVVLKSPNIYQANARVYLDSQSALRPLLQGLAVNPDVESDLALVRQAILSRPNLEKVARQTKLDLKAGTDEQKEVLISMLQKTIIIQNDARVSNSQTDGTYKISFEYQNRVQALGVVQNLLDSFVEDTLGAKRSGQEEAQRFLQEQMAEYEKKLSESELQLSEFKKRNVGSMPDMEGDYFQRLQTEEKALDVAKSALAVAQARRDMTLRQLSGEEPLIFGISDTQFSTDSGKSGDIAVRIREMEGRLEELLLKYTEKHPEVIAVKATLGELRSQRDQELAKIKKGGASNGALASSLKANPVYQSLQVEKNRAEVQVVELQRDVANRSAKVEELRKKINIVPDVEAELIRLNRDYEVNKSQYQQLLQRLETAKLSEQADKTGTISFRIIEPPTVSIDPIKPNRPLMLFGVLIFSIATGLATAYLFNQFSPVFQGQRNIESVLGVAVLGCVSHIESDEEKAKNRVSVRLFAFALIVLILFYIGVSLFSSSQNGFLLNKLLG